MVNSNMKKEYIIITDCLTPKIDEGCIKVANSLAMRLKKSDNNTIIVSCGNNSEKADYNIEANKLFLNSNLVKILKREKKEILYIPFASNSFGTMLRILILSIINKNKSNSVVFALRHKMSIISKILLKISNFKVICLSKESEQYFKKAAKRVVYLKTGVDTSKFNVVDQETKEKIRRKYGFKSKDKIILHVGHLKYGRNIDKLLEIDNKYKIVIVTSSSTRRDEDLQKKMIKKNNIRIINEYIPNIEEIYQMSDLYIFPVIKEENCIDIPLSVLEACSCNLPVITTKYGELKDFKSGKDFVFLEDFKEVNSIIENVISISECNTRKKAIEYNWDNSIDYFFNQERCDANEKE